MADDDVKEAVLDSPTQQDVPFNLLRSRGEQGPQDMMWKFDRLILSDKEEAYQKYKDVANDKTSLNVSRGEREGSKSVRVSYHADPRSDESPTFFETPIGKFPLVFVSRNGMTTIEKVFVLNDSPQVEFDFKVRKPETGDVRYRSQSKGVELPGEIEDGGIVVRPFVNEDFGGLQVYLDRIMFGELEAVEQPPPFFPSK